MGGWIEQHRLAKALCFAVPLSMVLAACTTGFNPGLGAGGRCMSTTGAPGSTNYFSYGPDCTNGAGPNHWIYKVWKAGYPDLQEGPIGLTDKTVSPIAKVGNTAVIFRRRGTERARTTTSR